MLFAFPLLQYSVRNRLKFRLALLDKMSRNSAIFSCTEFRISLRDMLKAPVVQTRADQAPVLLTHPGAAQASEL
jgi:hypothetical protein